MEWTDEHDVLMLREMVRGGSRRGCTRLLLYFNTNKPHSFFVCRIPVVLENRRSSGGGGAHPLHPPPRSAPELAGGRGAGNRGRVTTF